MKRKSQQSPSNFINKRSQHNPQPDPRSFLQRDPSIDQKNVTTKDYERASIDELTAEVTQNSNDERILDIKLKYVDYIEKMFQQLNQIAI